MNLEKEEIILSNYIIEALQDDSDIEHCIDVTDDITVREKPAKNGKNLGEIGAGKYSYKTIKEVGDNTWAELEDDKWILLDGVAAIECSASADEVVDTAQEVVEELAGKDADADADVDSTIQEDDSSEVEAEPVEDVEPKQIVDEQPVMLEPAIVKGACEVASAGRRRFHIGDAVFITQTASKYIGGQPIPDSCKGVKLYVRDIQPSKCIALVSREKFANRFVGRVHTDDLHLF